MPQRRGWSTVAAVGGSVVLHTLFALPLVLGDSAAKTRPPDALGVGSSVVVSTAEPMMTMIVIDALGVAPNSNVVPEDVASLGLPSKFFEVTIVSPDPTPAFDPQTFTTDPDAPNPIPETATDMAGRAQLFGRYVGQIDARIERAWVRPRSSISDPLFRCTVKIKQDKRGNVLEVKIVQCNGDEDWQRSLANAIQSASPLPAPPDPAVFADALTLSFQSEPFHSGGNGDGFEPGPIQVASLSTYILGPATDEVMGRKSLPRPGVIELRITGRRDESQYISVPSGEVPEPPDPVHSPEPDPETSLAPD